MHRNKRPLRGQLQRFVMNTQLSKEAHQFSEFAADPGARAKDGEGVVLVLSALSCYEMAIRNSLPSASATFLRVDSRMSSA